jgi:hypothetical protein
MGDFSDKVFVFSGDTFEAALADWVAEQIATYPHKEELIRIVGLAMRDFMDSDHVLRHKMRISAQSDVREGQ